MNCRTLILWALSATLVLSQSWFCKPYCSSSCASGVCSGCLPPFTYSASSTPVCTLTTAQTLYRSELPSDSSFTISNFSSSSPLAAMSCIGTLNYFFLGPFVANNYVYKAFSGLGTTHFKVDVFWSFGIFGTWNNQQLSAIFIDGAGEVTQLANQGQSCGTTQTSLIGCTTANTGCFLNKNIGITHSNDFLSVNFSSMGSAISTSSAVQAWGVKDLIIVVQNCDSSCLTCFGSSATNCASCAKGSFLQGSICILSCPFYTMPDNRTCVTSCPAYYYTNVYNSLCEACPKNCSTCTDSVTCVGWTADSDPSNIIRDNLAAWIILGFCGLLLVSVLLWKFCCSRKTFYDAMEEEVIDQKQQVQPRPSRTAVNQSAEKMEARWVEDIDELHLPKQQAKKTRAPGHIQGIGIQLTNLE